MSGTLRAIRLKKAQQEERQRKAIAEAQHQEELRRNREEVIAEVCKLFGWSKLDDFAQKMIDDAFSGQCVDIEKLQSDIAAWKQAQDQEPEETIPEQPQEEENAAVSS